MRRAVLDEALALKALARAGWVRAGVPDAESVAAHSWGVCWLAVALCPAGLDREQVLVMAVLHDLAEVRTGDVTPHDGVSRGDKARAEHAAIRALLAEGPALAAAWLAYEAQATPEARFVRQLDRLDMGLQALRYHREGHLDDAQLAEFLASARQEVTDARLRALLEPDQRD